MNYLDLTKQDMEIERTLLNVYRRMLEILPEGRLRIRRKNNRTYYSYVDLRTGQEHYIRKENDELIFQLKYRKYIEEVILVLEKNLKCQSKMLTNYRCYDPISVGCRIPKSYWDVTDFIYQQFAQEPEQWSLEGEHCNFHPEQLTIRTSFGLIVRSKSEAFIAEQLHLAEIPFRYEDRISLQDSDGRWTSFYPDFSFITPYGTKIYWEHLGLWEIGNYKAKNQRKFDIYYHNGIVISSNLLVTMDETNGGLDIGGIKRIIDGILKPLFQ